jgi:colanic acid biosynthesis glycosyl transferase WcaI
LVDFIFGALFMRILVVGINYAPDMIGVAKYNTELCESLVLQGHDVRIITAPPYYPGWAIPPAYRSWRYQSEVINGVSITRAPIFVPKIPTGAKRLIHHASFALSSAWLVISEAFRWRPDLVFAVAPSLMSAALASFVARRISASSWLHVQDLEVDAAFELGLLRNKRLRAAMVAIERGILTSFDRVSTISVQMVRRLEAKGIDAARLRELRNWIDSEALVQGDRMTRFRRELQLDDSHLIGLYAGTMSNKQGLELIVEAARHLQLVDPRIHLVLCGDGPHRAKLEDMSRGQGNIHFLGLQPWERFGELLSTADFHLIPQRPEAADLVLPSKLAGIFASGRPVIAMARPGTGLALEVEGAGLVVLPGDARAFCEAIHTLVSDAGLRNALGETARQRCVERWDKENILDTLALDIAGLTGRRDVAAATSEPSVSATLLDKYPAN